MRALERYTHETNSDRIAVFVEKKRAVKKESEGFLKSDNRITPEVNPNLFGVCFAFNSYHFVSPSHLIT